VEDRVIALEGVYNFRDFGGYPTADGARVRRRRLYRSAHLARASDADQAIVRDLGIKLVVDLRRPTERTHEPSRWPEGAAPAVIASPGGEDEALPPHMQFLKETPSPTREQMRGYMLSTYRRLPYDERHVDMFRDMFARMAEGQAPVLIHCAAGKDRTGIACALILHALGVEEEVILGDYELTNRTVNIDGIVKQSAERISRRVGRPISAAQLRPMAEVDAAYLAAAFDEMVRRSGGRDAYLADVLGVDAGARARLKAHLVE
jgi:protein-tyrosine phosphatase